MGTVTFTMPRLKFGRSRVKVTVPRNRLPQQALPT